MELKVWVDGIQRIVCGVHDKTTCQDIVYALAHATGKTGRFTLIERWRNSERLLAPNEQPLKVLMKSGEHSNDVQFILQWAPLEQPIAAKLAPTQTNAVKNSGDNELQQISNSNTTTNTTNLLTNGPKRNTSGTTSDSDCSSVGGRRQHLNLVKESVPGRFSEANCNSSINSHSPSSNDFGFERVVGLHQTSSSSPTPSPSNKDFIRPPPYKDPPTPGRGGCSLSGAKGHPYQNPPNYREPPPPNISRNSPILQQQTQHTIISERSGQNGNNPSSSSSSSLNNTTTSNVVNNLTNTSVGIFSGVSQQNLVSTLSSSKDSPRLYSHINSSYSSKNETNENSPSSTHNYSSASDKISDISDSTRKSVNKESHHITNGDIHSSNLHQQQNGLIRQNQQISNSKQMSSLSPLINNSNLNNANINNYNNINRNINNNSIVGIGVGVGGDSQYRDLVRMVNIQREKLTTQAAELTQYDAEIMFWEGKAKEQQRNMDLISKEISRLELASSQTESQILSLSHVEDESISVSNESDSLKSEIGNLRTELENCEQELSQCKNRIRSLNDEVQTTQQKNKQRQEEWIKRESNMIGEIERLKKELDIARRETEVVSELSGSLDKEVSSMESNLTEKKKTLERLVSALKEANLQSLTISPVTLESELLEQSHHQHQRSGSTRRMIGSPRQLENAAPTSKNPHGIWV